MLMDPDGKLDVGSRYESFEQVMSAMDKGDFGDLLWVHLSVTFAIQFFLNSIYLGYFIPCF